MNASFIDAAKGQPPRGQTVCGLGADGRLWLVQFDGFDGDAPRWSDDGFGFGIHGIVGWAPLVNGGGQGGDLQKNETQAAA